MITTAIEVKERPILFSAEMVRAILEGRKSQTRRVIKGAPHDVAGAKVWHVTAEAYGTDCFRFTRCSPWIDIECPYGKPGDRLWVKETFVLQNAVDDEPPPFNDGRPIQYFDGEYSNTAWQQPHYRATDPEPELDMGDGTEPRCKWSPSIFMPRWASRITLEIVKVRVERVQEISEEDAKAEGCERGTRAEDDDTYMTPDAEQTGYFPPRTYVAGYSMLWDSINAKRGYSFESNPWVWVIEFRRLP